MKTLLTIWGVLLLGPSVWAEPSHPMTREEAEAASRLAPREFPGLPEAIGQDLESRGCTIPQSYDGPKPQNAIQGQFHRPGQIEWAVLCSRDGESSILVYSASSTREVEELGARSKDHLNLETLGDGVTLVGFHRKIVPVGERFIIEHYHRYGGHEPPPIDHEGINDAYLEKASIVHYWHNGKWLKLTGAD